MSREQGAGFRCGREVVDLRLHVLDRQIRDADGVPVGVVDDLEIDVRREEDAPAERATRPRVTALLTGGALLYRLIGGGPRVDRLDRISWSDVAELDDSVHLSLVQEDLRLAWPERWCRDHIISRIPGHRGKGDADS